MKKFAYVLLSRGIRKTFTLSGKKYKLNPPWHVVKYSTIKYIVAENEENAREIIRQTKLNNHATGFILSENSREMRKLK